MIDCWRAAIGAHSSFFHVQSAVFLFGLKLAIPRLQLRSFVTVIPSFKSYHVPTSLILDRRCLGWRGDISCGCSEEGDGVSDVAMVKEEL